MGGICKIHWSSDAIGGMISKYYRREKWNTFDRGVLTVHSTDAAEFNKLGEFHKQKVGIVLCNMVKFIEIEN